MVVLKRLALGLVLMILASAVLLLSDASQRPSDTRKTARIALVQHASQPIIEEGVEGMLASLAAAGFVEGQTLSVRRYNAEGDMPTANTIAKEVVDGGYDLLLSATTPSLQTIANANRVGKVRHVFALVTDPVVAGVGITGPKPDQHPPWLVGYGTMQPVRQAFELARQLFPGLVRVGVVWNTAEANAEAQLKIARQVCHELGIELVEANAENSSAVLEAAGSLVARGVQAIWVPGDITVLTAVESVVGAGQRGGIPVFTSIPGNTDKGALFDVGANYSEVGAIAGRLAAQVLNGLDPRTVGVENVLPERITLNPAALAGLKDPWRIPAEVQAKAYKKEGAAATKPAAKAAAALTPGRTYRIGIVSFAPDPGADICQQGFLDGLRQQGLVEGGNLEVQRAHAQGEIANITPILQNFDGLGLDLIVPMTTPVLTGACSAVQKTPVVFTYVYDPIAAGAGTSFTAHLPHLTGVGSFPPVADTVALIQRLVPGVKTVGTLYNASEANSRKVVEVARGDFERAGIDLEEVTVSNSSEVFQAAQALVARGVQAFWITGDNTAILGFDGIVKVARDARLPLINNDPELVPQGALACVGIGFYQSGQAAALQAARVLTGTAPRDIPIENVAVKSLVLNADVARTLDVEFPADLVSAADTILDSSGVLSRTPTTVPTIGEAGAAATARPPAPLGGPGTARPNGYRLDLLEFVNVVDVEDAERGIRLGLGEAGLVEGRDFTLKVRNAQGDMPTLSALVDAALTDHTDLILTLSTPTLQAALQKVKNVPIVFTFVANAVMAGAGKSNDDHLPNVTGVPTEAAYDDALATIRECLPRARRLGTLFAPAEVNSEHYKNEVERIAPRYGFELVAVPVNSTAEASDAVLSLLSMGVDAIAQVPGNLTSVAFASIAEPARRAGVPVFGYLSSDFANGAILVLARDYVDGGREAGHMAARILRGESPAKIPFVPLKGARLMVNLDAARAVGLKVPEAVLKKAAKVTGGG